MKYFTELEQSILYTKFRIILYCMLIYKIFKTYLNHIHYKYQSATFDKGIKAPSFLSTRTFESAQ